MDQLHALALQSWSIEVFDTIDFLHANNTCSRILYFFDNARASEVEVQNGGRRVAEFSQRSQSVCQHVVTHHM